MMAEKIRRRIVVMAMLFISGCATIPSGPSVLVLPAPDKPLAQFQDDEFTCRQWAGQQVGISAQDAVVSDTAKGAAVGTLVGAGAGTLLGAASGRPGTGAAIGAGTGLLFGTAAGSGAGQEYGWETQRRYDFAYVQCMYTKGNQIPDRVHQYRIRRAPKADERFGVPPDYAPPTPPPSR